MSGQVSDTLGLRLEELFLDVVGDRRVLFCVVLSLGVNTQCLVGELLLRVKSLRQTVQLVQLQNLVFQLES